MAGKYRVLMNETFVKCGYPNIKCDMVVNCALKTTAGRANRKDGKYYIELSPHVMEHMSEKERENTVVHEACHIVVMEKFKESRWQPPSHGTEWQYYMRKCGKLPQRCHNVSCQKLEVKRYRGKCACHNGCTLGATQKKRFLEGKRYYCRRCRQKITAISKEPLSEVM